MDRSDRLDAFLAERALEAVWFARPPSFAWLTGASNVVDAGVPVGIAAAGYDGRRRVVTDNIEADRLREEALPADVAVDAFPWHASSLADAVAERSPGPAAADFPVPGFEDLDPTPLRQPLSAGDVDRYRDLGRAAADAVETVCGSAAPGHSEAEVAAAIRRELGAAGINAPVVLVGGSERAARYRHLVPTGAPLGRYALVSVTAEAGGLHASLTRTVAFDPPDWLPERHESAVRVETAAVRSTRTVGRRDGTSGEVFAAIREAYEAVGHPDEWREHHQGGAAGFAGREWVAAPGGTDDVVLPMAYAWNPTVRGAKSENTWLVTEDGVECLTTGTWGSREVEVAGGGDELEHPTSVLEGSGES